jgi:F-type H+-transporting ATPase subunit gamma
MKQMSTARLGRAMEQKTLTSAYIYKLEQIVQHIRKQLPETYYHPCITPRAVKTAGFVIIGGERGLCGGFNVELNRFAENVINEETAENKKLIIIGKKAIKHFTDTGYEKMQYPDLTIRNAGEELFEVSGSIFKLFKEGTIDSLTLVYTSFISPTRKFVTTSQLLPLDTTEIDAKAEKPQQKSFDFSPSPTRIFDELIPRFLHNLLFRALIESSAAEQSARMISMTSATDRAQEIIDELNLDFNRQRQALITRELAEVISGSEA